MNSPRGWIKTTMRSRISGADLKANLKTQVDGFTNWSEEISRLSKKGVDDGLIGELRQMGVKALPKSKH